MVLAAHGLPQGGEAEGAALFLVLLLPTYSPKSLERKVLSLAQLSTLLGLQGQSRQE